MTKKHKLLAVIGALLVSSLLLSSMLVRNQNKPQRIAYNMFLAKINSGQVSEVTLTDKPFITFSLKEDKTIYETDNPRNPSLKETLLEKDIAVSEGNTTFLPVFQSLMTLIVFVFAIGFIMNGRHQKSDKSFMKLHVSEEKNKSATGFHDIAGNEEAKENVMDIVDFLAAPDKYNAYGARMPKGIIFYGPPGTGKTLMAKAIAGEAGVPFFSAAGSDFVQMYVGVGAARIRELFQKARDAGQAVIFIDEIDALGKKRSAHVSGGNEERDQTLNALLTEMSGFHENCGVIVIAATNRLDMLDEALLRPGRFDRQVEIGLPDLWGREMILKRHGANKPLAEEVDLKRLAKQTVFFSGAMLENLLNEAAIFAAKAEKKYIDNKTIEKAYYTIVAGSEKKNKSAVLERDKKVTAFHESGHALVTKIVAPENTVAKVTIIPSTKGAGGFCVNIPPDKMYYTKKEMEAQIMISLSGRGAEEIVFGKDAITTGASNDIEKATALLKDYVCKYGMNDSLLHTGVLFGSDRQINETGFINELNAKMEALYIQTKRILSDHQNILYKIAEALLEKETLSEEELDTYMKPAINS